MHNTIIYTFYKTHCRLIDKIYWNISITKNIARINNNEMMVIKRASVISFKILDRI